MEIVFNFMKKFLYKLFGTKKFNPEIFTIKFDLKPNRTNKKNHKNIVIAVNFIIKIILKFLFATKKN